FGAPKLGYTLAKLRQGPRVAALIDGAFDEDFAAEMLSALRQGRVLETPDGRIRFQPGDLLASIGDVGEPQPLAVEQSNLSIAFGDALVLKIYRRLRPGLQPDVEVARFLTETARFENTPAFLGLVEEE